MGRSTNRNLAGRELTNDRAYNRDSQQIEMQKRYKKGGR